MFKRVFTKMVLSSFILVSGLFLWSGYDGANAHAQVTSGDEAALCIPGGPDWPNCARKKKVE